MKCPNPNCDKEIDDKLIEEHIKIHHQEVFKKIDIKEKQVEEAQKAAENKSKELKEKEAAMKEEAQKEANVKFKNREAAIKAEAQKEANVKFKNREAAIKAEAQKEADKKLKVKETAMKEEAQKEADKKLKEKEAVMKTEVQKEEEKKARKKADEEWTIKYDKVNKANQIKDYRNVKIINDLKRRLEDKGSSELKGEVQEQIIEDFLREKFGKFGDTVENIKNFKNGADDILNVFYKNKRVGSVYVESKDTKKFEDEWIPKLIKDMKEKNIEDGVLITKSLPDDFEEGKSAYLEKSGIKIVPVQYDLIHAVVSESRQSIIYKHLSRTNQTSNSTEGQKALHKHMTGPKPRLHLRKQMGDFVKGMKSAQKQEDLGYKMIEEANEQKARLKEMVKDIRKYYTELSTIDRKNLNVLKEIEYDDDDDDE